MTIDIKTNTETKEPYTQPLLTKLDPLHNLTGKSGEKDPSTEKDPNADKDPNEKTTEVENN